MGELDLDAIKAAWRGFDARLWVALDEDNDEWVITSADDGSPDTGVLARLECDYAEQLGALWAGAGPQVAELVAEVQRLRAERDRACSALFAIARAHKIPQHIANRERVVTCARAAAEVRDEAQRTRDEAIDQLAAVAAERDALRAIVEGRTTPPTDAEIDAHHGPWLVRYGDGSYDVRTTKSGARVIAKLPHGHSLRPVRWWPLGYGRPCAWPEVSRG